MTDRQAEIAVAFDGYRAGDSRVAVEIEPDWIRVRHSLSSRPLTSWQRRTHAGFARRGGAIRFALWRRFDGINRGRWPSISYGRKREHADPEQAKAYRDRTLALEWAPPRPTPPAEIR